MLCAPGRFSNATGLSDMAQCNKAQPGYHAATGSTVQRPCAKGTYTDAEERDRCNPCIAGSYQDDESATECKPCDEGHYCPEGASAPLPCPGGTFSTSTSLSAEDQCTAADPGYFAITGSLTQQPCAMIGLNNRQR